LDLLISSVGYEDINVSYLEELPFTSLNSSDHNGRDHDTDSIPITLTILQEMVPAFYDGVVDKILPKLTHLSINIPESSLVPHLQAVRQLVEARSDFECPAAPLEEVRLNMHSISRDSFDPPLVQQELQALRDLRLTKGVDIYLEGYFF
jgi:hypothetical protein